MGERRGTVEGVVMANLRQWLNGRTVLVTGHTGFKGSWLTLWLHACGAHVVGVSLAPDDHPHCLFTRAKVKQLCTGYQQDIRDYVAVAAIFQKHQPEIVFHLAAQALVRPSYDDPLGTFSANIMGTAHVLEAARNTPSVKSLVCVTTDKVYRNNEQKQLFTEDDSLCGHDPYSASKAAAEMVAHSYMHAILPSHSLLNMATARGGNVVGGGDWAQDRLVPDVIRAVKARQPITLRNPQATRPWQHVLDLCHGYMLLAHALECEGSNFTGAWNFGPAAGQSHSVGHITQQMLASLGQPQHPITHTPSPIQEAVHLQLDATKANTQLGWHSVLNMDDTIKWTCEWYREYLAHSERATALMQQQIAAFEVRI